MCDSIVEDMEWVFDLDTDLWKNAQNHLIYVDKMIPSQDMVTIPGMMSIEDMYRRNYRPQEPILLIRTPDGYILRDGHHRWVRAMLHDTPSLFAFVIEDPRKDQP